MPGGDACIACGENEFEIVDCQKVCTSCGLLTKDDHSLVAGSGFDLLPFTAHESRGFNSSLPKDYVLRYDPSRTRYFTQGLRRLKELSSALHLTEDMVGEAKHMIEKAVLLPDIVTIRTENKLHMTAAVVYIVCLRRRWPMSVDYMAGISGYPAYQILRYKKLLQQVYKFEVDYLDIEEIIKPTIAGLGLSDACCRITEDIVMLCKDTWISHGRNPVAVVQTAIYIAWKTEDPLNRAKTKHTEFRKRHKLKYASAMQHRHREMMDVILKLAKQLPWLFEKKLNDINVIEYIPDVLRYRKAMMHKALAEAEMSTEDDTDQDIQTAVVGVKNEVEEEENGQTPKKRKKDFVPPSFNKTRRVENTDENQQSFDQQVDYQGDLNSEELSHLDIPESQLTQYIKSEEEVKAEHKFRSIAEQLANM